MEPPSSPGGTVFSPVGHKGSRYRQGEQEEEKVNEHKVLGCIPHEIHGDFGFICRPLSCVKYWINPSVMVVAIIVIWSFVIWCAVDTERASRVLATTQSLVVRYFGWWYITCLVIFASFAIYLCFSKYGSIKLGPEDEPPKYSLMTWFSMLFSAGIGAGLYFFGVAEPLWHFQAMQEGESRWYHLTSNQQAMEAINITWFHWGFTASSTYVVAALPLAYHHHVKKEPLRESICFMALLGEKYAEGVIGCLIDLTSIIGTMFGVATSLGIGVLSINAGLAYIFDVEQTLTAQLVIIWVITAFATISVLTGLDAGIRRLSEINFAFSFIVLFFMFFALDPFYLLNLFVQGIGYHFQWILELTFNTQAFEQCGFYDNTESTEKQITWMSEWTIFYWAWWIAWAPFVGIFIAEISRGRTVREFIIGNMMVPTLMTCIWFSIFGGVGLYNELGSIQNGVECTDDSTEWYSEFNGNKILKLSCFTRMEDILFATLSTLPLSKTISIISMIGIVTYFVTSSDSASHIIDILTAGGNVEPPKLQRIFWALSEGAVASVLLAAGNGNKESLTALQTASLVAALPFSLVLIFESMATYKTLMIHTGELKPDEQVYWNVDLFECAKQCPQLILALVCPPYYQTKTRLNIIASVERTESNPEMDEFVSSGSFENNGFKYVWITGYWLFWALCVLLLCLEFVVTGFFELGLTAYVFYLVLSIGNRHLIKEHYQIDSSHIIFDLCSWLFCCCCAAVQEHLQSNEDMMIQSKPLKVKDREEDKYIQQEYANGDHDHENESEMTELSPPQKSEKRSFLHVPADSTTDNVK